MGGALAYLCRERGLTAVFDSAYQGYASGDLEADARAVRIFEAAGVLPVVCQSYAKSMGLYGERLGAVNFVLEPGRGSCAHVAGKAEGHPAGLFVATAARAQLAALVLGEASLFTMWQDELNLMAERVRRMRIELRDALRANGTPSPGGGEWSQLTDQIGMFSFTGLSSAHVDALRERHHVYMTRDGRMCMAALKPGDVAYVAEAMRQVMLRSST